MKRLLVTILCAFALQTLCFGHAKAVERYGRAAQDKKEVKNYDIYVGQYEVSPAFTLTITNEDNKLMGEPTGAKRSNSNLKRVPMNSFRQLSMRVLSLPETRLAPLLPW